MGLEKMNMASGSYWSEERQTERRLGLIERPTLAPVPYWFEEQQPEHQILKVGKTKMAAASGPC